MDLIVIIGAATGFATVFLYVIKVKYFPKRSPPLSPSPVGQVPVYAMNPQELAYHSRPLLNHSEIKVWRHLDQWRSQKAPALQISTQVAYGEFLGTTRDDHYRAINTKRADFTLWDKDGHVRAVIEFDGKGHWGDTDDDAQRASHADQIKNRALSSAAIPLLRVAAGYSVSELHSSLDQLLAYMPGVVPPTNGGKTFSSAPHKVS